MHTFTRAEPELEEEGERKAELLDLPIEALDADRASEVNANCV
jgi:hypothetical protein